TPTAPLSRFIGTSDRRRLACSYKGFLFAGGNLVCRAGGGGPDCADDPRRDRRTKARAGVPARTGLEAPVASHDYVAEGALALGGIDGRLNETGGRTVLLVGDRDEPGPQRRDRTCGSDHHGLAVDPDHITGRRIGIARYIG